ncbi:MAG: type II toxin-antitoxin system RelE/ParE family toxin [Rhodoferax sp.]|nr:type II toxin-antitoxin system RelE/ParE family toxin [Rhodoferax sp.]
MGRLCDHHDTRERVVSRDYLVTYRVRADEILLLQVRHQARNGARGSPV